MIVLENDRFVVDINELGAELKRIYCKTNGIDYLWRGNLGEKYWQKSATLLFPFVGRLQDGKYNYNGIDYEIGCHGFAKSMTFSVVEKSDTSVLFNIVSNDETRECYPFDFYLGVRYILEENHLKHEVIVKNTDSKEMLFKLGFHPAFNVPLTSDTSFEDWKIVFEPTATVERRLITERGLDGSLDSICSDIKDNELKLSHGIFKDDALVLKNTGNSASIRSGKSGHGVTVNYSTPWVGLWQTYTDDTPFVAIEPWYHLPGKDLVHTKLEEVDDLFKLLPGDEETYSITIDLF